MTSRFFPTNLLAPAPANNLVGVYNSFADDLEVRLD